MTDGRGEPIKLLPKCDCRECDSYHSWPYTVMVPNKRGIEKRTTQWGKQCEFNPDDIHCKGICLEGQTCFSNYSCQRKEKK